MSHPWHMGDPGAGDRACVLAAAERLRQVGEACMDASSVIDRARCAVADVIWTGQAADAWRTGLDEPRATFTSTADAAEGVRFALVTYADAVRSIAERADAACNERDEARSRYHRLVGFSGDPYQEAYRERLQAEAQDTERLAERTLADLADERAAADAAVVAVLRPPGSPRWEAMKRTLAAAGISTVDELSVRALSEHFATTARLTARNGLPDLDDVASLQAFFDVWGRDPAAMARFYAALGGSDTVGLVDRLGDAVTAGEIGGPVALALATGLREGLSVASQRWSTRTASEFAAGMLDGASPTGGGRVAAVGFLFSDAVQRPLGMELTVAVADVVDLQERTGLWQGPWSDRSPHAGGRVLSTLEGEVRGWSGTRADDLAGRVFSTLGAYPTAALEWLMSTDPDVVEENDDLGAARIVYWYGERDWSDAAAGDGFEGPATFWAGAQQVPGGPTDASAYSATAWERVATLTTLVAGNLVINPAFLPENLSELGSTHLAEGISLSVPYLAERPVYEFDGEAAELDRQRVRGISNLLPGMDSPRVIPDVSKVDLATLLAGAVSADGGREVLVASVGAYQDALVGLASGGRLPNEGVLDRVAALQGLLDGAGAGGRLATATRHDAAVQEVIDLAAEVVGAIPVPGAGKLVGGAVGVGVDLAQGVLVGRAANAGGAWAGGEWAASYEAEMSRQEAGEHRELDAMEASLRVLVDRLGQPSEAVVPGVVDEYVQQLLGRYDDARERYKTDAEGLRSEAG